MATRSSIAEVNLKFTANIRNTLDDGQAATVTVGEQIVSGKKTSGVSASQSNRGWEDRDRTISSGNTEDIDLYDFAGIDIGAGAGNDGLGQAMRLEEIVTIIIKHESGAGSLEIMPSNPSNHWTPMPKLTVALGNALKAGGCLMMTQPDTDAFDVTDGGSHVIRLGANGGAVTYSIYVEGRDDDNESSSSSSSSLSSSSSSSSSSSQSSSSQSSSSSSSSSVSSQSSQSTSSQSSSSSTT